MKNAIVTFAIGKQYQDMYGQFFKPSVEKYCKKYDIDLVVITDPIEPFEEKQALCCQKLLICSQDWAQKYDAICWLESDILISPNAQNIFDNVTDDKILFVDHEPYNDYFYFWMWRNKYKIEKQDYAEYRANFETKWKEELAKIGLEGNSRYVNEGVTVFQPKLHAKYLEELYRNHDFKNYKPSQQGLDGTFHAVRETWWWNHVMTDGRHRFIDNKYNSQWNYYRRIHLEPFDDPQSLIIPIKNYIESSYFCHIGDRENIDLIHFVHKTYHRNMDTTLVVNCKDAKDLGWLFISYIRAKKFKDIFIVCKDDSAKQFIHQNFPRIQNAWYSPNNLYTFVNEKPNVEGRVIECDSDWIQYKDLNYMLELFYIDKNESDIIKVKINYNQTRITM